MRLRQVPPPPPRTPILHRAHVTMWTAFSGLRCKPLEDMAGCGVMAMVKVMVKVRAIAAGSCGGAASSYGNH